jgi:transcriptional antiterminator RfaH
MTLSPERSWCVVQTHANAEAKAAAHLVRQGYEVYLPRYLKRRSHARKVENVPAPLFPRYLFVGLDLMIARWRAIQSTLGVSHLVCSGHEPATLSSRVVSDLRAREDSNGFVQLSLQPRHAPGDRVRVIEGVFGESFGSFEGMADRNRVAILLDLLGRKVRVVLDEEAVAAA